MGLTTAICVVIFVSALPASAIDIPGWPIVPCGLSQDNPGTPINEAKSCGRCDLFQLLKNIIDFTIGGLMPPVAILLFVWAGFLILLGGANINWYNQGRTIFQNTFWGIVIMLSAWLITNTLILSVGSKYNDAQNWWQFTCIETVPAKPPIVTLSPSKTPTSIPIPIPIPIPTPSPTVSKTPTPTELVCKFTEVNLCQASNRTPYSRQTLACSGPLCDQYVSAINRYAGGSASANLIKAIMIKESTCNAQADSGHAQGLMQLKPSTANIYKRNCGITADINSLWLKDNPELSICIAAEYIRALSQTSCRNSARNIAAGYNGGSSACQQSRDCAAETSCAGGPVQRWECLYDSPQHNVCNTGYDETRDYAVKVLYCYNNPGF